MSIAWIQPPCCLTLPWSTALSVTSLYEVKIEIHHLPSLLGPQVRLLQPFHSSVSEKMGESDSEEVSCSAWTNKQSKVVQPDLNFIGGCICWYTVGLKCITWYASINCIQLQAVNLVNSTSYCSSYTGGKLDVRSIHANEMPWFASSLKLRFVIKICNFIE